MTAFVGDQFWLNCTGSIGTNVEWWFIHSVRVRDPIYRHGKITDDFELQFTAHKHNDKEYSLVISNVTLNNSGTYACIEDKGQGRTHYYVLNVRGISLDIYLLFFEFSVLTLLVG